MLTKTFFIVMMFASTAFSQERRSLDTILQQMKYAAREKLIDVYYPKCIDTLYGGYLSSFSYDFKPVGEQDKMIVTQSRHVWSTAKAALFYKDTGYTRMSRHGFYFLRDKMWDKEYGGFYTLVNRKGEVKNPSKEAYGNAFGVFALAAYYKTSRDPAGLELAKKAFAWLDKNSHDPKHKGYFQHLQRDGKPVPRTASTPGTSTVGYKDQNSSIHLLEAFTELYSVWPDPLLKERLHEMLVLIRDKMVHPKGYLQLYFKPDWTPVSYAGSPEAEVLRHRQIDHVSFGHDVETAYLMMEATEALGNHHDVKTAAVGKLMVDHALANGWDKELGGFYDEGYYFKGAASIKIIRGTKNWWAQAEGFNTLLVFSKLYPSDKREYGKQFEKLWKYVHTYLIDHQYGDWYQSGLDKEPGSKTALKAQIWKASYHNFRALSNCINHLEKQLLK